MDLRPLKITPQHGYQIKDLIGTEGDVYCYDEINECKTVSRYHSVTMTARNMIIHEIETDEGVIKVTHDHPILTKRGWVKAFELLIDDDIVTITT